ncbi:uncharacterized protein LOC127847382 [Dreissena polymorpha]|uniref:Peptidase C14 caspase domain-containing protein n=1 Tax=Dreissena polymorpha TaxID=45954 RepID=A0A9D4I5A3_DREPO|nr:uncharacterized protein LOC127847382 [Dreissena polymorpha]XP_052235212.1 uncharacterized protein LOC127847382 [Dreissena polymorpha]KAH3747923.1 hypothetical protein DPMN_182358 [Dreissena polymorpha]
MSENETGDIRTIPENDFKSETYIIRKPVLVTFIAQDKPRGATKYSKQKSMVEDEDSQLKKLEVDIDVKLLDDFFRKQFTKTPVVELHVNNTYDEIHKYMKAIEADKYDGFFFVFLTYLYKERNKKGELPCLKVECYDSAVPTEDFMGMVKKRKDMALKPKVFIFQADDLDLMTPNIIKKATGFGEIQKQMKIPTDADQLMIISTLPQLLTTLRPVTNVVIPTASEGGGMVGQPSDESEKVTVRKENSLLIKAFVDVLEANRDVDVFSCTPLINGKVEQLKNALGLAGEYGQDFVENKLVLPVVYSTLTKDLHLYQ